MLKFNVALELDGLNIGDKRLNERCIQLIKSFETNPQESIPTACKTQGEMKAAYRFFKNSKVTSEKILSPHFQATKERIKQHPVILYIEDTTEIDLTDNSQ